MDLAALLGSNVKLNLLFRGSYDGYKHEDFAARCHNKGKTLCIIKSDTQKIFGGYTPIPWDPREDAKHFDNTSFLFSIRDDYKIVKLKSIQGNFETIYDKNQLIEFYNGDLRVLADCNIEQSYTSISHYESPPGLAPNSDAAKYFLTHGNRSFIVQELEVYSIK